MKKDIIVFGRKLIIPTMVIVVQRRTAMQCHQTRLSTGKHFFHFFGKVAWKSVKKLALFQKFQNLQKLRTWRLYVFIVEIMLSLFYMWSKKSICLIFNYVIKREMSEWKNTCFINFQKLIYQLYMVKFWIYNYISKIEGK